jgi:diguanylate cyclase (GGDEF)-like protein/PAS domain S-box-containing protein
MTDRCELLDALLDNLPDGIAILGEEGLVQAWNPSAEALTGFPSVELVGRPLPEGLEPLVHAQHASSADAFIAGTRMGQGALVHTRHKLGHNLPVIARIFILRNGLAGRIGTAVVFHPAESLDALPHGESSEDQSVQASQTDLDERLHAIFGDFQRGGHSFGVLWITVDQSNGLRKTHGARACEAMLEKIVRTLIHGLRPAEEMGRWGDDEFLVISHERTAEALAAHAQVLAGLARTADFRWWGDRVSLTVSIGAAQAEQNETLAQLLGRAQAAMLSSVHAGGNHITPAAGRQSCSPS